MLVGARQGVGTLALLVNASHLATQWVRLPVPSAELLTRWVPILADQRVEWSALVLATFFAVSALGHARGSFGFALSAVGVAGCVVTWLHGLEYAAAHLVVAPLATGIGAIVMVAVLGLFALIEFVLAFGER